MIGVRGSTADVYHAGQGSIESAIQPAFIINGGIIPGAVSLDALRELVSTARES